MTAGWVAGSVRARALARHRVGPAFARQLAASGSLEEALRALAATAYGRDTGPDDDLAAAQHGLAGMLLWDLRVLAGWLPRDGVEMLRTLAAWFELANVDEMLSARPGPEFELGALATAWPRLREAGRARLRSVLAASAWEDPGGDSAYAIRLGLRASWAAQVAALGDPARTWAVGATAVLLAGERFAADRPADPALVAGMARLLGPSAGAARSLAELAAGLPERAGWALAGIGSPAGLWRAEVAWRARVERDGLRLLRTSSLNSDVVLGAVAVMACDALRVRAALEAAARGPGDLGAYDEVA